MCLIDCNNYSEGTSCFVKQLKGVTLRHFIFVCSGRCKGMTERRKLRSREPSRICTRLRLLYRKIEREMLIKRVLGAVPGSSILNKFRQSSIRKEHVCLSISLRYQLKRRKRRKSVVLKNRCKILRDNNHQSLYKKLKLYNDIQCQ